MDEQGITLLHAVDNAQVSRLTLDRLQARYELPLALAKLFVRGDGLLTHEGVHAGLAMFFDMNTLFEAFLTGVLLEHRDELLPPNLQDARILPQGEGDRRPLLVHESTQRGTLYMRPDVLFQRGESIPLIIDFKYKKLNGLKERSGVAVEDLYQMFAYSQRYHCPEIVLIFPSPPAVHNLKFIAAGSPIKSRFTIETLDLSLSLTISRDFNTVLNQLKEIISRSVRYNVPKGEI